MQMGRRVGHTTEGPSARSVLHNKDTQMPTLRVSALFAQEGVMTSRMVFVAALVALTVSASSHTSAQGRGAAQPLPPGQTNDPFPQPIARDEGVITVTLREFASLPDIAGVAARMMRLVEEPATRRLFVS